MRPPGKVPKLLTSEQQSDGLVYGSFPTFALEELISIPRAAARIAAGPTATGVISKGVATEVRLIARMSGSSRIALIALLFPSKARGPTNRSRLTSR
jgi:hypothetical protein